MKRILLLSAVLAIILLMTGCFQYSVDIVFDPDGKTILKYGLSIDKSILEMGDSTAMMNSLNSDSVQITEQDGVVKILKELVLLPDQYEASGIRYEKHGSSYTFEFSPDSGDFLKSPEDSMFDYSFMPPVQVSVTILKGRIKESNADSVKENTAYFSIHLNELSNKDKWPSMKVSTGSPFMNYIIFFAALALIFIVIMIIYYAKR